MSAERHVVVRINKPFWEVSGRVVNVILRLVFRFSRAGMEHLPSSGGTLIVSNHLSFKDPVLVGAGALPRPVHFMAKVELFRVPILGGVIRRLGAFPVRRGAADRDAIRTARELLAAGEAVVMFPEGTRSRDGRLRPAFPGAGSLALEPGITVVPAAVWGSQRRFGPIKVVFGPPVDLSSVEGRSKSQRAHDATQRVMQAIADLVPLAGGPPQEVAVGEPSFPG
jgi:1-acyl-sn-glycerol-3-phosphate acyltransferase